MRDEPRHGGGPARDLTEALESVLAVDHHAHPLADPGHRSGLLDVLTEADHPAEIERVRHRPVYHRALRDLAAVLGVEPEDEAIDEARDALGAGAYARGLLSACRFAEVLIDDGFAFPGALSLDATAAVLEVPVRRILRIEAVAEASATGWPPFSQVHQAFLDAVEGALDGGASALKTIAAYRGGLDLPPPEQTAARAAYDRWRRTDRLRLADQALVSYFVFQALEVARIRPRPPPLQVHTGYGDRDLALHRSDPSLLRPLLQEERYRRIPIVLLHCYPFVRNASYLAGLYPNVYLDLSLAVTHAAHRGPDLILEGLDLAPASKLLFATDASRLPELFFLAARWWRQDLAAALGGLVEREVLDRAVALRWGEMILAENARQIYGREGAG